MTQKAGKKRIKNREQMGQALELRKAGASYQAIGDTLGLSKTRAYQLIMAGLEELEATTKESAASLRTLMLQRLDAMQLPLWGQRKNPRVADTLLRIEQRRAALEGLDAPLKVAPTTPGGEALPPAAPMDGLPTDLLRQVRDHLKAAQKPED